MKFTADFHIHSHYSKATSSRLTPEHLEYWARIKGINVLGTGDCIHPGWLKELREKLEPADNGLFVLKRDYQLPESAALAASVIPGQIYFILTGEISSIYKKAGKVRKVHNVSVFPDFSAAEKLQGRLEKIGSISSDGRPILGADAKDILEMTLESSESSWLFSAHIWTPWFSVLGSKSGFDSMEECYEDLTDEIFAAETGLSSDPPMNRLCSFLDRFNLISNSDAHSPDKLGREANLFDCELSYGGIFSSLKSGDGFDGTIEFFPQEGKYHYDGHRKCGVCWNPLETVKHGGICAVCGKPVTKGVMYRVAELADRDDGTKAPNSKPFYSITALPEIFAELRSVKNSASAAVQADYFRAVQGLGSEFDILLFADLQEISSRCGDMLAEGIRRLRSGEISLEEGYDGEFGSVKLFRREERDDFSGKGLFPAAQETVYEKKRSVEFNISEFKAEAQEPAEKTKKTADEKGLTEEQMQAVRHIGSPCMVIAGPGTGKTAILTERIISLVKSGYAKPENILAVTFSNNAAKEMSVRIKRKLEGSMPVVLTFHAFGLSLLRDHFEKLGRREGFMLADAYTSERILSGLAGQKAQTAVKAIDAYKRNGCCGEAPEHFAKYEEALLKMNAFDLNDLICLSAKLLRERDDLRKICAEKYRFILIDELQDINAGQYELVKLLAGKSDADIFAIGDPDQSIYSFRGANPEFTDAFFKDFPGARKIILTKSFRCPEPVVRAAVQALGQIRTISGEASEIKINISRFSGDKSEAEEIATSIERLIGGVRSFSIDSGISDGEAYGGESFSDFAILCRSSFMFAPLVRALQNHGIPFRLAATEAFYNEGAAKQALDIMSGMLYGNEAENAVPEKIRQAFANEKPSVTVALVAKHVGAEKSEIRRLTDLAGRFKTMEDFLTSVKLCSGEEDIPYDFNGVSLMTVHAAKGLEFRHVFIPGCEDGIIPFNLFAGENTNYSEEERIFYVAATRTSRNLYLSYADRREFRGRTLRLKPSPLLERIQERLLKRRNAVRPADKTAENIEQLELF